MNSLGPVLIVLPIRYAVFRRNLARLQAHAATDAGVFRLPGSELRADLTAWTVIGLLTVAVYHLFYDPYLTTGFKIFIGCIAFGLFGGMLSYLSTENRIILALEKVPGGGIRPGRSLSLSRKMFTLIVAVLSIMALAILLMVLMDVYYLLENLEVPGPHLYWGIFKEVAFVLVVLLSISLLIIYRFSGNLRRMLASQLAAMDEISRGNLDRQVPVLTGDEFARLARKTNDMIQGLKDRDLCQSSFERYVSPEVSSQILEDRISPEGEIFDVTVLFCDLRGYTSFVEKRNPREVVAFMNRYFTAMDTAVRRHGGVVLQYIGDEIEAVFGAPVVAEDHAVRALRAALDMRAELARLNAQRRRQGEEAVGHGIGINTGTVLAGNVGSPERMVYAMVGDTVNVAARLQVLNKTCGTDVLFSRSTMDRLTPDAFRFRGLGSFPVKGKSEQVEVFTL